MRRERERAKVRNLELKLRNRVLLTLTNEKQARQNILRSPYGETYGCKAHPKNLTGILMPVRRSIITRQRDLRVELMPVSQP